jgi:hypothetical protein
MPPLYIILKKQATIFRKNNHFTGLENEVQICFAKQFLHLVQKSNFRIIAVLQVVSLF